MNKFFRFTSAIIVVAAVILGGVFTCAYTYRPEGIEVVEYSPKTNYMLLMQACAENGSKEALMIGSIYEAQRNLKIDTESLPYEKTYFFDTDYSPKQICKMIQKYINPAAAEEKPQKVYFTENDITIIAKILYNECRGVPSRTEQACVAWVILNRFDAGYGSSIEAVATAPNQFAYSSSTPVTTELRSLAEDVLTRWNNEKNGMTDVGRVLPPNYLYFNGSGGHNHFRTTYTGGTYWDYSLPSPYNN